MVCIWHINMCLMKKARPLLGELLLKARSESTEPDTQTKAERDKALRQMVEEAWKKILKLWNRIVYATTVEEMN